MRLLHLSDPHFGTEQAPVAAALQMLARELRPDVLVLSGDITQRARPEQFAAARAYVDALGVPVRISLPGNHDISLFNPYERFIRPYARYRAAFGEPVDSVIDREELLLITAKTTRRFRHKHGQLDGSQIERVAQRLRSAHARQLRIVVVHQPMHVPREQDEENLMRNADAAARSWSQAGADLVLGGHIHLPYVLPMSQRYRGLVRELWCVQAGTALSSRVRWEAPNSVNVIDYSGDAHQCLVTRYDYQADSLHFAGTVEHDIPLHR